MRIRLIVLCSIFLALSACGTDETPIPTGPPQTIPPVTPTDAGPPPGSIQANKIEVCSVEMVFDYTDQMISFKNKNDQTARATVRRTVDDTVMVSNYLFPKGEDSEAASFAVGNKIEVLVEFLDLNLSLSPWKKCDEKTYVLGQ